MKFYESPIRGIPPTFQYKDFLNFVAVDKNQTILMAKSQAYAMTQAKSWRKHIVFITGGINSGKTHLALAIAKEIYEQDKVSCMFIPSIEFFINVSESRGKVDYIESLVNSNQIIIVDNYNQVSSTKNEYLYLLTEKAKHRYRCVIITSQQGVPELQKANDLIMNQITYVINVCAQAGIENVIRQITNEEIKKKEAEIAEAKKVPKYITYNTFGKPFAININDMHPDMPKHATQDAYWLEMTGLYQGSIDESDLPEESWVRTFSKVEEGMNLGQILRLFRKKYPMVEI